MDVAEELTPLQQVEREELARAFREVFNLAAGKRVLFWMLEQCAIYQDADCGEATHATAGMLGEQRVGRKLIAALDGIDPRLYPQLLMDRAEIRKLDKAAAQARAKTQEKEDEE
jgi:hypothetical protein